MGSKFLSYWRLPWKFFPLNFACVLGLAHYYLRSNQQIASFLQNAHSNQFSKVESFQLYGTMVTVILH